MVDIARIVSITALCAATVVTLQLSVMATIALLAPLKAGDLVVNHTRGLLQ